MNVEYFSSIVGPLFAVFAVAMVAGWVARIIERS